MLTTRPQHPPNIGLCFHFMLVVNYSDYDSFSSFSIKRQNIPNMCNSSVGSKVMSAMQVRVALGTWCKLLHLKLKKPYLMLLIELL